MGNTAKSPAARERVKELNRQAHARRRMRQQLAEPEVPLGYKCIAQVTRKDPMTGEVYTRRCGTAAIDGQRVCKMHGGHAPQALNVAEQRKSVANARTSLIKLGLITERDPREVLLEQVYAANGMVLAVRELLQEVDANDLGDPSSEGYAVAHFRLGLYTEWTERAAKISKMALDAGIDERMVKLAEGQAQMMVTALKAVVLKLALDSNTQREALRLLGQELRNAAPIFQLKPGSELPEGATIPQVAQADPVSMRPRPMAPEMMRKAIGG